MREQEKKRQRIYDLLYAETKPFFIVYRIQSREIFLAEKEVFKKKGSEGLKKKRKKCFLNAFAMAIKQDPLRGRSFTRLM